MEYFIGSVMTIVTFYVINKLVSKKTKQNKIKPMKFSQSNQFEMIRHMIPIETLLPSFVQRKATQSTKHFDSKTTRVLYMDNLAWFIKKVNGMSILHVAEVIDGNFDEESAKRVDTMTMDDVELKKTMFIVEKLTEGL
jgi:uncharacterized protein YeeX (DUF496 family)